MGSINNGIAITALIIAIIGAILVLEGPDWTMIDEPVVVTKTLSPGLSFEESIYIKDTEKMVGDIQSAGLADINVKRVWFTLEETALDYHSYKGQFEFGNRNSEYYHFHRITIKNPENLGQGDVTYTLKLQKYAEHPSQYMTGIALLSVGVIVTTFSAFKPDRSKRVKNTLLQMKLIDTTFRMSAICIAFVGVIGAESILIGASPVYNPSFFSDAKNISGFLYAVLGFSVYPLAVFSYFISPRKIGKQWKLDKTTNDAEIQNACNIISKELGLKHPPEVCVVDAPGASCFTFGNNLRKYKLVITSRVKEILDKEEMTSVLTHELAHALHKDMIFITWAEVYLNYAKYWILAIVVSASILAIIGLDQIINSVLFISIFSVLGFLYSYFLINSISRDREILSDIISSNHTNSSSLKSALIKIKKESLNTSTANRLLLFSLDDKLPGFMRSITRIFLSTHPTLKKRLDIIEGRHTFEMITASNVVHIGLLSGFTMFFFLITFVPITSQAGGMWWILVPVLSGGLFVGFLHGLYFAYQNVSDSYYEYLSKKKKAVLVWISCVLSLILGNSLAIFIQQALNFRFDSVDVVVALTLGTLIFVVAFPVSLFSQKILERVID